MTKSLSVFPSLWKTQFDTHRTEKNGRRRFRRRRRHGASAAAPIMKRQQQQQVPSTRAGVRIAGKLTQYPPVFSLPDGKFLFCPSVCAVHIVSTATAQQVGALRGQHRELVTAIVPNRSNTFQLYSASLDGTVCLWDYLDGICLR